MGHRGDVHPLKRSVKAHLLNNVLGKLNAMLSVLQLVLPYVACELARYLCVK